MDNDDVYQDEDSSADYSLQLADREMKQRLTSIENASFHEGFEEYREPTLQKAFEAGYKLAYVPFQAIATLEGISDSLTHAGLASSSSDVDFKKLFVKLYADLFECLNKQIEQDIESKSCLNSSYSSCHIVPSSQLVDSFKQIKAKLIDLCIKNKHVDLASVIENTCI